MIGINYLGKMKERLANQMFQYAAVKGIAKNRGFQYCIPPSNYDGIKDEWDEHLLFATYELNTLNPLQVQYMDPNRSLMIKEPHFHFSEDLFNNCPDNTCIVGYFQSEKYFSHCEKEIREQFAFDEKEHMFAWHHVNKGTYDNPICVHVRRGDYAHYNGIHDFPGKDYYHEAMKEFPDGRFVFYSDDLDWCREEFPGHDYVDKKNPYQALQSMSCCRGHIIANSSFSWWAAWLRGKNGKTVAPSKWFGPKGQQDWQDIYCEGWKVI